MRIRFVPHVFHDNNPNIEMEGHYRLFILLTLHALALLTLIYWLLGTALDKVVERVSIEREEWIWQHMKGGINRPRDAILLPEEVQKKINALFDKIPKENLLYNYPYRVYATKAPEFNAYAMPGGHIVITKGLLNTLSRFKAGDETLIFTLGHELGHFQNRDHLKKLGRSLVLTELIRFFLGDAATSLFLRTAPLYTNSYSRQAELKADMWGIRLLYDVYHRAQGAEDFFKILGALEGSRTGASIFINRFLSTHPGSHTRAQQVNAWVDARKAEPVAIKEKA